MKRMVLTKLTLSGEGKFDAVLNLKRGLNVISGDSDTGKTYAYQCLNYVLGAETLPKEIVEAKGYTTIALEFSVEADKYCLKRQIGSNRVVIFHDDKIQTIASKHDSVNNNNLSRMLLQLLLESEDNILLKKNQNNEKRTLSFRDLVHLCTVDETSIIAEMSSFQGNQYTERTVRNSLLKYVVTGVDDSKSFEHIDAKNENIRRAGVVQYLERQKEALQQKIKCIESDDGFKAYCNSESVHEILDRIKSIRNDIANKNAKVTLNQIKIEEIERQSFHLEHQIAEFSELQNFYEQQHKKYGCVATYADFLYQLPELSCPICHQSISEHTLDEVDSHQLFAYFRDINIQIQAKMNDLKISLDDSQNQLMALKKQLADLKRKNKEIGENVAALQAELRTLNQNIAEIRRLEAMKKELEIYKQNLQAVLNDIVSYKEKVAKPKGIAGNVDSRKFDEFCETIRKTLNSWGLSCVDNISFNVETADLIIDDKARATWGKGYRAFVMSAMVIGLMRYCRENDRLHPGFVVLDSPLVSLKARKLDPKGKWIEDYMERKMIEDIIAVDSESQVIIFENKDISYGLDYNYIEFRHEGNGRNGFIPPAIERADMV